MWHKFLILINSCFNFAFLILVTVIFFDKKKHVARRKSLVKTGAESDEKLVIANIVSILILTQVKVKRRIGYYQYVDNIYIPD